MCEKKSCRRDVTPKTESSEKNSKRIKAIKLDCGNNSLRRRRNATTPRLHLVVNNVRN